MSVTSKVKSVLQVTGQRQLDLADYFSMSKQAMNNKMRLDGWSASDLIKVAAFTGCELAFIFPDGTKINFTDEDIKATAWETKKSAPDAPTSGVEE